MDFYGTLGGACSSRAVLDALFAAGMTGARLNLSHTALTDCADLLTGAFQPAARQAGLERPHLIIDLQGPELRVGALDAPMAFPEGKLVVLGRGGVPIPRPFWIAPRWDTRSLWTTVPCWSGWNPIGVRVSPVGSCEVVS